MVTRRMLALLSFFYGIPNFMGSLMPKLSLHKNSSGTI